MITVTAGILTDGGRMLVCQRRAGGRFPLKWEFPGGKVEDGESPEACLRRELREELAIEAEVGPEIYRTEHRYPNGFAVRLLFFQPQKCAIGSTLRPAPRETMVAPMTKSRNLHRLELADLGQGMSKG